MDLHAKVMVVSQDGGVLDSRSPGGHCIVHPLLVIGEMRGRCRNLCSGLTVELDNIDEV